MFKEKLLYSLILIGIINPLSGFSSSGATLNFRLITWNETNATDQLPSAAGHKPSASAPVSGDWLIFTGDDVSLAAANNSSGALSHNFVDLTGMGGAGFNMAPSLSGTLTLRLERDQGSTWAVAITALNYAGQANAMQTMNQLLVTTDSPAAIGPVFNVDGAGNSGQWVANASSNWTIQYVLDFYLAASADGNPLSTDIDATFNDKLQTGFLIPVYQLTTSGLASVNLDDPLGFYGGDFEHYLLSEIAPRLPSNATYLLITQMEKSHPGYVEGGLPITTSSLIGNTTFAYTTETLAAPPLLRSLRFENGKPVICFTGSSGQVYQIQRSENLANWETIENPLLNYSETDVVEWTDIDPVASQYFYRIIALTP
ncbi:MAG TPA: hypothetical protein VFW05_10170 [Verrucomicrobiae bacterium]|nr:hypothetical protein [Verrucomicrobiae bacterium]